MIGDCKLSVGTSSSGGTPPGRPADAPALLQPTIPAAGNFSPLLLEPVGWDEFMQTAWLVRRSIMGRFIALEYDDGILLHRAGHDTPPALSKMQMLPSDGSLQGVFPYSRSVDPWEYTQPRPLDLGLRQLALGKDRCS